MKQVIALMLGLVAGTASFAQSTADQNPDVVVTSTNQKVRVFVAPQPTKAFIKLFDNQGHVLYTQTANLAQGFRQQLNLTQLEPGSYRLTVVKDGQTIDKTVVIQDIPAQKQVTLES